VCSIQWWFFPIGAVTVDGGEAPSCSVRAWSRSGG
jgi:hypothetical protein